MLAEACQRAGLPAGAVNIVCGYGYEAGAALAAHRDIDQIVFTGSVATGQSVLRAAVERVVPCVMELGGKSGAVVYADADLDRTAASAVRGIFNHAGQICSAGSRLIVHRSVHDDLMARVQKLAAKRSVGPGVDGFDMGPLINARQLERVEALCRAGRGRRGDAADGWRADAGVGRAFHGADDLYQCASGYADCAGRILWPGAGGAAI